MRIHNILFISIFMSNCLLAPASSVDEATSSGQMLSLVVVPSDQVYTYGNTIPANIMNQILENTKKEVNRVEEEDQSYLEVARQHNNMAGEIKIRKSFKLINCIDPIQNCLDGLDRFDQSMQAYSPLGSCDDHKVKEMCNRMFVVYQMLCTLKEFLKPVNHLELTQGLYNIMYRSYLFIKVQFDLKIVQRELPAYLRLSYQDCASCRTVAEIIKYQEIMQSLLEQTHSSLDIPPDAKYLPSNTKADLTKGLELIKGAINIIQQGDYNLDEVRHKLKILKEYQKYSQMRYPI